MRWFSALLAGVLTLGLSGPVEAAKGRGINISVKAENGAEVALYAESHALVIGISNYTNGWPKLRGVREDIPAVKTALEKQGFKVTVVMDPDRDSLDKAFRTFIARHGQKPDNRLLFYYAGHGHSLMLGYGGMMGYLVPNDAPDPNLDEGGFLASSMSMQSIEVYARNIQSKHALFMFDSCFSGSIFDATRAIPDVIQEKTGKPVRQFITSGSAEQEVPDRSIFRRQFIEALNGEGDRNGDGYVTGAELGDFLETKVTNYSRRSQTPQYGKLRDPLLDKGDFVFVLPGGAAVQHGARSRTGSPDETVWKAIQNSRNPVDFRTFLATFPNSPFAPFARARHQVMGGAQITSLPSAQAAVTFEPTRSEIREAQRLLTALGYDTRGVDGIAGSRTVEAVQRFRTAYRVSGNGIDLDLLKGLRNVFRALQTATARNESLAGQRASAMQELRFSYEFRSGRYVRKLSGAVKDARGLWNALAALKPPPGARGDYGLIGDDHLLGKENGYGLRQLGLVARRYLTVENLYVEQPEGFGRIGVQSGTFTRIGELNDTTLGWVLFDLRGKLEGDLKKLVN